MSPLPITVNTNALRESFDISNPNPVSLALLLIDSPWPERAVELLPNVSWKSDGRDQLRGRITKGENDMSFQVDLDMPGGKTGYLRGFAISIKGQKHIHGELVSYFDDIFGSPMNLFGNRVYMDTVVLKKTFRGIHIGFKNPIF